MDVLLTDICARALIFLAEDGGYRVYQSDMHDLPDVHSVAVGRKRL
jgi:hypothetical protein